MGARTLWLCFHHFLIYKVYDTSSEILHDRIHTYLLIWEPKHFVQASAPTQIIYCATKTFNFHRLCSILDGTALGCRFFFPNFVLVFSLNSILYKNVKKSFITFLRHDMKYSSTFKSIYVGRKFADVKITDIHHTVFCWSRPHNQNNTFLLIYLWARMHPLMLKSFAKQQSWGWCRDHFCNHQARR